MITVLILVELFYILISSLAELCCCVLDFFFFGGKNICLMLCSVSLITSCIQIILIFCKSIIIYTFIVSTQEDLKYWCRMHSLILWLSKFIIFKCIQVRHFISLFIPCFLWTELAYAGTYHHVIRYFMCDLVIRMWSSILRIISQLHLCLSLFALMSHVLQNSMDVLSQNYKIWDEFLANCLDAIFLIK